MSQTVSEASSHFVLQRLESVCLKVGRVLKPSNVSVMMHKANGLKSNKPTRSIRLEMRRFTQLVSSSRLWFDTTHSNNTHDPAKALVTNGIETPLQITVKCACLSHTVKQQVFFRLHRYQ